MLGGPGVDQGERAPENADAGSIPPGSRRVGAARVRGRVPRRPFTLPGKSGLGAYQYVVGGTGPTVGNRVGTSGGGEGLTVVCRADPSNFLVNLNPTPLSRWECLR